MKPAARLTRFIFILCLVSATIAACGAPAAPTSVSTEPPITPLRIAILPILDAIPFYVARDAGYFTAQGVEVELIPASSAAERDQLIASGQADGMINDLVSVALYNRTDPQVQVVRFMRVATPDISVYRVLSSPNSQILSAKDLAGVEIGISQGSIIDYVTDQMLKSEGLTADQIVTVAVPKIPDRLSLLLSDKIQAATLPEPFATVAELGGAHTVVSDANHLEVSNSVISFRKAAIDTNPAGIRAFLAAVEQAVADINANPNQWSALLAKENLVPKDLLGTYAVPAFPTASIPTQAQYDAVVEWALARGLITQKSAYTASVTSAFLPEP